MQNLAHTDQQYSSYQRRYHKHTVFKHCLKWSERNNYHGLHSSHQLELWNKKHQQSSTEIKPYCICKQHNKHTIIKLTVQSDSGRQMLWRITETGGLLWKTVQNMTVIIIIVTGVFIITLHLSVIGFSSSRPPACVDENVSLCVVHVIPAAQCHCWVVAVNPRFYMNTQPHTLFLMVIFHIYLG